MCRVQSTSGPAEVGGANGVESACAVSKPARPCPAAPTRSCKVAAGLGRAALPQAASGGLGKEGPAIAPASLSAKAWFKIVVCSSVRNEVTAGAAVGCARGILARERSGMGLPALPYLCEALGEALGEALVEEGPEEDEAARRASGPGQRQYGSEAAALGEPGSRWRGLPARQRGERERDLHTERDRTDGTNGPGPASQAITCTLAQSDACARMSPSLLAPSSPRAPSPLRERQQASCEGKELDRRRREEELGLTRRNVTRGATGSATGSQPPPHQDTATLRCLTGNTQQHTLLGELYVATAGG